MTRAFKPPRATRALKRHHDKRIIRKRVKQCKNILSGMESYWAKKKGALRKTKPFCDCNMCSTGRKSQKPKQEWPDSTEEA